MPVFKIDIEKLYQAEFWTNRYLVETNTLQEAADVGDVLVALERTFHSTLAFFTKVRTSTFPSGSDTFIVRPVNLQGQRAVSGELLPLFVTVRVDFPAGFGRPSRKFYRACIGEGDIGGTLLTTPARNFIQTSVDAFIPQPLVDPQATPLGQGSVQQSVQMRQLRRGSRRRQNPIIP